MKKRLYLQTLLISFFLVIVLSVLHLVFARHETAGSERTFDRLIVRNDLVVAMFYESSSELRKDRAERKRIQRFERMFKNLSNRSRYKETKVAFLRVNVAKKGMADVAQEYGIEEVPAFVLFDGGELIEVAAGKPTKLVGYVSRHQLQEFIEQNLKDEIDEVLKEKEERRRRRREEAVERSYYYGYGYSPYYSPYYYGYGFSPYYGGYGLGLGFSFGGRHHRRHGGHHRGGHRGRGRGRGHGRGRGRGRR